MRSKYKSPIVRVISLEYEVLIAESNNDKVEFDTNTSADPEAEIMSREDKPSLWDTEW